MRILLADAQALTREGLKRVALEVEASTQFIEAANAAAARTILRGAPPLDAALFDEGLFGLDELATMRGDRPGMVLLALAAGDDAAASARMLVAGVDAIVPKSAATDILAAALRLALAGDVCVRGNRLSHPWPVTHWPAPGSRRGIGPLNLTSRQYEVLGLVAQGRSNKAISTALGIGLRTVKGHVSVILRALHADNRIDAGRAARRWLGRAAVATRVARRPHERVTG